MKARKLTPCTLNSASLCLSAESLQGMDPTLSPCNVQYFLKFLKMKTDCNPVLQVAHKRPSHVFTQDE